MYPISAYSFNGDLRNFFSSFKLINSSNSFNIFEIYHQHVCFCDRNGTFKNMFRLADYFCSFKCINIDTNDFELWSINSCLEIKVWPVIGEKIIGSIKVINDWLPIKVPFFGFWYNVSSLNK